MSASKVQRTPSRSFERVVQGLYLRADERLAAKGKLKEAEAAQKRVERRRELIEAQR